MLVRVAWIWLLLVFGANAAVASEARHCLSRDERQVAIRASKVVPLAAVIRQVKARHGGEVLRVRLCEEAGRLVYRVTLLRRSGKVVRALVDARNGTEAGGS